MSVADWLQRSLGSGSSKREGALDGLVGMRSSAGISSSSWKATDNVGRLLEELCRPGVLERRKDGERHLLQYIDAVSVQQPPWERELPHPFWLSSTHPAMNSTTDGAMLMKAVEETEHFSSLQLLPTECFANRLPRYKSTCGSVAEERVSARFLHVVITDGSPSSPLKTCHCPLSYHATGKMSSSALETVGDDANKTKRLWEMLSPALEYADDITLIETMARTMGRLVKSGGAMASDIVDLEVSRAVHECLLM
eukprot:scaffold137105_cov39-Tisochrysis_lutea.AAC.2